MEQLHPGTYGILGSWTGDIFKIAIGLLLTPPIIYLLVLFIRLSIMCTKQGISCNTVAAVWRGVKSEFMDSNNRLVIQIQDQAFSREETMDLLNREIESGVEMPNRMIGALTQKTRLIETKRRLATISTGKISLRAKFTEMARELNAPLSSQ